MTRKKVKLMWIVNDSARKASLKKRRLGLLKKVSELTTLCDINAFIVIYSPDDKEPAMWPSRPLVQQLLARFNSMPEMERCKKMTNQETYLKERVNKVQDQLKKHHRKNKEADVSYLMLQISHGKTLDDCSVSELQGLIWFVQEKRKDIRRRLEFYQQFNPLSQETSLPPTQLPAPVDSIAQVGGSTGGGGRTQMEPVQWDQWFIDMMNNTENTAVSSSTRAKSEAGLTPHQALAASSSAANQMGFLHGNLRTYTIGGSIMGLSHGSIHIGSSSAGSGKDIVLGQLDENINVGGNNNGNESNLGLPQGNSGAASSDLGLPSEFFGDSIARSDVGLPYDVTKP